jgi:hypothetical protein
MIVTSASSRQGVVETRRTRPVTFSVNVFAPVGTRFPRPTNGYK